MSAIGPIRQLGYVTQDVEAAAMHWINKGIAGPFFLMKGAVFGEWNSEGKTASATLDIAFGQSGDVMIELITPRDGALDLYRSELLKTRICNPHHLGYLVKDLEAVGQSLDTEKRVVRATLDSKNYFEYYDTRPLFGQFTEIIQDCPENQQFFDFAKKAASEWDGKTEPLREASSLG